MSHITNVPSHLGTPACTDQDGAGWEAVGWQVRILICKAASPHGLGHPEALRNPLLSSLPQELAVRCKDVLRGVSCDRKDPVSWPSCAHPGGQ